MTSRLRLVPGVASDDGAGADDFARAMIAALSERPRSIAPKYFYDARGSAIFEEICDLPEYYPTRTELAILQRHAPQMAAWIGPRADVIEFGAGSQRKVRILLDALDDPVRYLPLDISAEHLEQHARALRAERPGLEVTPVAADFTRAVDLPDSARPSARRVGFFPGSSIGNFRPEDARAFLAMAARLLRGGGMLIGVDLVKAPEILHRAYNDGRGVTAAFNRNLLVRANRELQANFDPERFAHYAFYHPTEQRVEMHLLSSMDQTVQVCGRPFRFRSGESLHTENSYKYTPESFGALARLAGFEPRQSWVDERGWFGVLWLESVV